MKDQAQLQQLFSQAQLYQQQLQALLLQKETLALHSMEIKKALEEIEKSPGGDLYKIAGPVLIKAKKDDIQKELKEKDGLISSKIEIITKSEDKFKEKIEELKGKLTKINLGSKKSGETGEE